MLFAVVHLNLVILPFFADTCAHLSNDTHTHKCQALSRQKYESFYQTARFVELLSLFRPTRHNRTSSRTQQANKTSFCFLFAHYNMNIISLSWLGYDDEVKDLITKNAKEVNQTDEFGDTALHAAAAKGRLPLVHLLIENGADVNAQNKMGSTPLHKAMVAKYDQIELVNVLLKKGADPNVKNKNGFLPEDLARDFKIIDKLQAGSAITVQVALAKDLHGRYVYKYCFVVIAVARK